MQFLNFTPIDYEIPGLDEVIFPKFVRIRQLYDKERIANVAEHVLEDMKARLDSASFKGKRICLTVGSRGIPDLDVMLRAVIDQLNEWGATPFLIPSMGSHGGACVEGQLEIMAGYNITEESMGVPIRATMDVREVGHLADGTPVLCDAYAMDSDGIVFVNKIKPHTDFRGAHESGLAKMMAIGIANHHGASMFHRRGFASFAERIPEVCEVFLRNAPVAFGVGIVQNAYDDVSDLEVVLPEQFLERDAALLEVAKSKIATFKHPNIDVLIIDQIGKNISGNGHDPNITGRSNSPGYDDVLNCQKVFIRGLTEESHHKGAGLKGADITTRRCLNSVDWQATWTNVATVNILTGGVIPMFAENDEQCIRICVRTCLGIDYSNARIVRILDTLHMNEIEVSLPYYEQVKNRDDVEPISDPYELVFEEDGALV